MTRPKRRESFSLSRVIRFPRRTRRRSPAKKAGDVTDPFELTGPRGTPKYAVVQLVTVNEAGQYVESEVRERIRQQLVAERATRQLLDDLRKHTYVALRL